MSKFEFAVLGNLDHDQVKYRRGDRVIMSDGEAEPLIALGILLDHPIGEIEDEVEADPATAKPKSGKPRKAALPDDAGSDENGAGEDSKA